MRRDNRPIWLAWLAATFATLSALCFWAAAHARQVEIILATDQGATVVSGRFEGATLGEPIRVMVDTSQVFGSGFE